MCTARSLPQLAPGAAEVFQEDPFIKEKDVKRGEVTETLKNVSAKQSLPEKYNVREQQEELPHPPGSQGRSHLFPSLPRELQRDPEPGASEGRDKQTSSEGVSSRSTTALEN